jgi:hypothetical protein
MTGGAAVSTQPQLQPDPLEELKTSLEDAPRGYGFLSDYVRALEWHQHEEDIFIQHAFESAKASGTSALRGGQSSISSALLDLYEPLDAGHKLEIMRWWHEMVRGKATRFTDLKARLSKLS